jgi:hypothetical protein
MTPELQRYYENRFVMMPRQNWRGLLENISLMVTSLNNVVTIQDEKDLQFNRGGLSNLNWLRTLR